MSDKQEYVMVPREASPEMIDAYLRANDAYWKRMDEMPPPPNKWRTGTPKDATAESYRAMLQAAPPAPAMHASAPTGLKCADCHMDKEACPTCYEAWWKARHPNSQQMPDVAPPAPVAHSKSEYKRRVAMGDASILPPAPVAVHPAPVSPSIYDALPPGAMDWLTSTDPRGAASREWQEGWDACRNRVHSQVDAAVAAPDASPSPAPVAAPVVTDAQFYEWAGREGYGQSMLRTHAKAGWDAAILAAQSGAGTRGEQT